MASLSGKTFADIYPKLLQNPSGNIIELSDGTALSTINAATMLQIGGTDLVDSGTWSLTLKGNNTAGDYSVSAATGTNRYYVFKDQCTVYGQFDITVNTAGSGTVVFGGLPVAWASGRAWVAVPQLRSWDFPASSLYPTLQRRGTTGGTEFALLHVRDNATTLASDITNVSTGTTIILTMTYPTA